ncbi:MAG: response regulator transcription factor [Solirubrobacterales bacterium]|nr:response regulator transcription factor [Solirubrobacterales bacterium]
MDLTSSAATVLVFDPRPSSREYLADNLAADGFTPLEAATECGAWQLLGHKAVDLAVIDIGQRDGLALVRQVRQASRHGTRIDADMPLVALSPRATEVERLRAFEQGCDDLLNHPYSYAELRARITAILRRVRSQRAVSRMRVGPLEVDALASQAWLDGRPLQLTAKQFSLLAVLASEPSRCFSRAYLLEAVWGYDSKDPTRTVDAHASRLRRKLAFPGQRFVISVWGIGYRLVSPVALQQLEAPAVPELRLITGSGAETEETEERRAA